jgi:hypothetical protein
MQTQVLELSLARGGLLYRLEKRIGFVHHDRFLMGRRVLSLSWLAWGPLAVLTLIERNFTDGANPFVRDLATHARCLLAIPLLLIADVVTGDRLGWHTATLRESNAVAKSRLEPALRELIRMRDNPLAEAVLLALAYFGSWLSIHLHYSGRAIGWAFNSTGKLNWSGGWLIFASLPLFQFLLFRWLWRLVVWSRFLSSLAQMPITVSVCHPDRVGGLGWLGEAQSSFFVVVAAMSVMVAATAAYAILFGTSTVAQLGRTTALLLVIVLFLFLAPLLVFAPVLLRVRRYGLERFRKLGMEYTRAFERRWFGSAPEDQLLGTPDIQSLADLSNSFEGAHRMRPFPFDRRNIGALALAAVLPMLIAGATRVQANDLMKILRALMF